MYEGIKILNGTQDIDLLALPKNSEGQLLLEGIDVLKIILEDGAKFDKNITLLENDSDAVISLIDSSGDKVELVLLGISEILLTNNDEIPVFEVFEGSEKITSITSIDELEAAAAGNESSPTSFQTEDLDGDDNNTIPDDNLTVATRLDEDDTQENTQANEANDPIKKEEELENELTFSGNFSAQITEDYGLNGEDLIEGKISNSLGYPFVAQSMETQYGIFTIDEEGNWTYDFFPGKAQELKQGDIELDEFTVQVDGSDEQTQVGISITGLNDTPIIQIMSTSVLEDDLDDVDENQNMKYQGELEASDSEGDSLTFTKNGSSELTISTQDERLVSALNPATADLDYVKSVLAEIVAIPEVQNALTNNLNAVEDMDVTTLLAQFEASSSVSEALALVLGALGLVDATLTQDDDGVHLYIPDASALEAEGLLSIEIDSNGEYVVTSVLFNNLSVEDTVKVSFDYIVDDGTSAASQSATLEVGGSNDSPVLGENEDILSIDEDAAVGTVITTIAASDVDISDNIIYSLEDTSGKFAINPLTGDLTLISELDYETQNEYTVDVKVTDNSGAEDTKTLTISVNDIAENDDTPIDDEDDTPIDDDETEEPQLEVSLIENTVNEEDLLDLELASGAKTDTTYEGVIENSNDDNISYARAGAIGLTINTVDAQLISALTPATADLDYVKATLSEIMAIPEVQIALTNNLNAVENMDVTTLLALFQAATTVQEALGLVTNALGLANASLVPTATGLSLVVEDASALEVEGLLNVVVNFDGTYSVTSPLFDHLSVDDSVEVSFDYSADDGVQTANNTVNLTVNGTNDILEVSAIEVSVEENDLLDIELPAGSSTDTTFKGQIIASDVDVNDNTSYARAGAIGLTINTVDAELLTIYSTLAEDLVNAKSVLAQIIAVPEVAVLLNNALASVPGLDLATLAAQLQNTTSITEALSLFSETMNVVMTSGLVDLNTAKAALTQIVSVPEVTQILTENYASIDGMDLQTLLVQFQTASTGEEALSVLNSALTTALNPLSDELAYVKSLVAEIIAIPEVTIALTNSLNAVPGMDVTTLLAQFQAANDIESALELVTSALGLSGVQLLASATGLSLVIENTMPLEAEGLLNVVVNSDGTYSVTSPLFDHLSVDDSVEITFDYSADDGIESKVETVTLEVTGSDDIASAQVSTSGDEQILTISEADPDINDSGIIDMAELLSNTEGLNTGELDEINVLQGSHILSNISVEDVLSITDTDNTLEITGDAGDKLLLSLGSEVSDVSEIQSGDLQWHKDTSSSTASEEVYVGKTSTDETITLLINGINVEDI